MFTQFIWSEIDYLVFFKSLSMMLLAATAIALMLRRLLKIPWGLLAACCVCGWVSIWTDLLVYAYGNTRWLTFEYMGFRFLAGVFLFEFVRRSIHQISGKHVGAWIYLVWGFLAAVSLLLTRTGPMMLIVILLMSSGAGVIWIMFRLADEVATARWFLKIGGVTMFLYVVTIIPSGLYDPWRNITSMDAAMFPRQFLIFLQGGFLLVTALAMWRLFWNAREDVIDLQTTGSSRIQIWMVPLLCLVFGLNWVTMASYSRREANMLKENSLLEVRNIALGIKTEQIAYLKGTQADYLLPEYQSLKMTLKSLCNTSQFHSVFIIANRTYGPDMLVDSRYNDNENESVIMSEIHPTMLTLFKHPNEKMWGPVQDECGHWMVLMSPIFDPESNVLIGFMGAKKDFREWQSKIAQSRLLPMGLATILSFMLIAFFIVMRWFVENKLLVALSEARYKNLASKSAFLANVSHEIRTPLNAILGFSQWILRDPRLPGEHRKHLETIQRSGDHLLGLINNLLEMSRLDADRVKVQTAEFDLKKLVHDLAELFTGRTVEKHITFRVELGEFIPSAIISDEGKLRQIFINLLANAIKFTEHGEVVWKVACLRSADGRHGRLTAFVTDTGPGIAEADQRRIFEAFEQTRTGLKAGGTGLGLSICKEFIQMLGGQIKVTSTLGEGSCFYFWIPIQWSDRVLGQVPLLRLPVRALKPSEQARRILVADDRAENRELLRLILEGVGFSVREVQDSVGALAATEEWKPEVVLLDLHMLKPSEWDILQKIKALNNAGACKVIVITGSERGSGKDKAEEFGADALIAKPIQAQLLLESIGALIAVEYLYEERLPEKTSTPDATVVLPEFLRTHRDWLDEFRDAVEHADYYRVLELLENPDLNEAGLGEALKKLADRFEYQKLLAMLPNAEGSYA